MSYPRNIYAAGKIEATSAALSDTDSSQYSLKKDYQTAVLKKFLESYNSPLAPYSQIFVEEARANNIDWRMVAAISGVESTFGQQIISNSHNAWGWGIYGRNVKYFNSYDEAIKTISKSLRQDYMDKWGATDVYQIGRLYAASPTWASRVNYFMNKMSEFETQNSIGSLSIDL